jgi:hypothetical protein
MKIATGVPGKAGFIGLRGREEMIDAFNNASKAGEGMAQSAEPSFRVNQYLPSVLPALRSMSG